MSDMKWLEEIERRNAARTPGKWMWTEDKLRCGYAGIAAEDGCDVLYPNCANDGDEGAAWFEDLPIPEDAQFIVRAPEDVTTLTKALRVAVAALEKIEILSGPTSIGIARKTAGNALAEIGRMGREAK